MCFTNVVINQLPYMAQASSLHIKAGGVPDYIRGSNRKLQDFILFQKVKQSTKILKYLTALLGA